MSLNNIQLGTFLTSEMYKDVLVETPDLDRRLADKSQPSNITAEQTPKEKNWEFKGGFRKKILLLIKKEENPELSADSFQFLNSMLTACKLAMNDVAILNLGFTPANAYKDVQLQFKAEVIILFGITPREFEMPVDFPEFQVQAFSKCTFLSTPSLEEIGKDKLLKSKLWVSLRKIFGV